MKRCPTCQRTYTTEKIGFCLEDGTALQEVTPVGVDTSPATQPIGSRRETFQPPERDTLPTPVMMGVYVRPDILPPPPVPVAPKTTAGFKSGILSLLIGLLSFGLMTTGFVGIAAKNATNLAGGLILLTFLTGLAGAILGLSGVIRAVRNGNSKIMPLLGFLLNVVYLLLILGILVLGAAVS